MEAGCFVLISASLLNMTRKEFIRKTGIAAVGACGIGLSLSLEGCSKLNVRGHYDKGLIKVKMEDLEKSDRGYSILRHDLIPGPVYLQKEEETGKWVAILMVCTHARCEVYPSGDRFVCPCHGSEFSMEGQVIVSPAEDDLFQYPISEMQGHVSIKIE